MLTVYTVGFDEVRPIDTPELRAVTIALIVTGCTGMIFLTGTLIQLITASQLQQFFGSRRMQKEIEHLTDHVIICGYGRIGQMLARELQAGKADFVIIERGDGRMGAARDLGFLSLPGDATDEDVLRRAGVARARALATVLPDDAANVFITLSARSLKLEAIAAGAFLVVALERRNGETLLQPAASLAINEGDGVAIVGRSGRAQAVESRFRPTRCDLSFRGAGARWA